VLSILLTILATLPLLLGQGTPKGARAYIAPCAPDTVEVIEQQILAPDTTYTMDGIPHVTCRVVLCVPEGVDLNEGRKAK